MEIQMKKQINRKKFIFLLAAIVASSSISSIIISDFFIVATAAFYAVLLCFDYKKKLTSALLPLPIIILSVFGGLSSLFIVCSGFCCGLCLWFCFKSKLSKTDTVLILTAFFVFYLLFGLFLSIGNITHEYNVASVIAYYEKFIEEQKAVFIETFSNRTIPDENGINHSVFTAETAEDMFLSVARLVISFFVISAFLLCGVTCKIFSKMLKCGIADEGAIRNWTFFPPTVFSYFYCVIFILSFFMASSDSVYAIAIQNLSYIFMFVFSYIGLRHLLYIVRNSRRKKLFIPLIILGLFMFNLSAVQVLSFFGVYITILSGKVLNKG